MAEATPQGKTINPNCLGTGKAVFKTINAKVKNGSVAVDPPATKKSRRINNGERNKHKDGCEHWGGRHDSKDCWELPENKDKRPDW
jgi:hypothetical protein